MTDRTTVLVTGANGFIGRRCVALLRAEGRTVRGLVRHRDASVDAGGCAAPDEFVAGDLLEPASLDAACQEIDAVVHCAGHAHAFASTGEAAARVHWQVNHEGTRNLVDAAGRAGVRRMVFLSSVKAMSEPGAACVDQDWPGEPDTDYGLSKRAAEREVHSARTRFGMHAVVVRLAMVYGPGSRGNLERMFRLVRSGRFPPLPETGNRRSLVHVDDVAQAVLKVLEDRRADGRTYIVAYPDAYSGRELYQAMREAAGMPRRRGAVPRLVLLSMARVGDFGEAMLGRRLPFDSEVFDRLLGSACYSPGRLMSELGWRAQVGLLEGLATLLAADAPERLRSDPKKKPLT